MSSTVKINGNFFQVNDTTSGDEIIRSNRANTTFSIDSADVFSFYFDSPIKTQFPLGTDAEVYPFSFAFTDLIDARTGLAFVSVADLEDYLSSKLLTISGSDATVENSDLSYTATVASGDTLVLPDTTVDVYVDGVFNSSGTIITLGNDTINITV